jgi:ribonuclease G
VESPLVGTAAGAPEAVLEPGDAIPADVLSGGFLPGVREAAEVEPPATGLYAADAPDVEPRELIASTPEAMADSASPEALFDIESTEVLATTILDEEEPAAVTDEEAESDSATPKRRRSRRGSRGGRRNRGRRGAAGVEEASESAEAVAQSAAEEPVPPAEMPAAPAAQPLPPEYEQPLPDVLVHFRPVARSREATLPQTQSDTGAVEKAPGAAELPAVDGPGVTEGEPASRGRRRRRRGERGERAGANGDREERASGVGGALPPRAERTEAEVEAPAPAPEAPAERPRVERVGRGQRGDRVLERAIARAEREAGKPEREAEKAERTTAERTTAERITKEIVVNVSPRETRIAVLENGRLVELHVEREERVVGSVFKGRVANVLPGMDAAFVDIGLERNAWLHVGDILFEGGEEDGMQHRHRRDMKIRDVAKPGQEILVQVVKGPRGTKGARVSTRMSLPGRYLVLMPEAENLGVSRKIEDPAERDRLKRIGEKLRPGGFGMIIRTEAEERTEEELRQDLDLLLQLWKQIQEKNKHSKAPSIIHQDLSLILKTIRDVFGADVDKLMIDSEEEYQKARETLSILSPDLIDRVSLYAEPEPIFSRYGLEDEIERLLRRKVWLRSGGYIIIDASEALTAIDVNTGKFVGSTSLSDTILKMNLDAVQEIARQLRLRDIGGMIVLDFIDMNSARDRAQVMAALDRALKKDRTRTKVAHISPLGLIEMTRKRTGETVTELITQTCEYCQGRGRILSAETLSIQIERAVRRHCAEGNYEAVLVLAHPEVCAHLIGPEGENVEAIEQVVRRPIYIRARHDFHLEKYEILPGDMLELEKSLMPYHGGQVVECEVQRLELITAPRSAAWVDGYFVDLANGTRHQGSKIRIRLTDVRRSFALGDPVAPHTAVDKSEPI